MLEVIIVLGLLLAAGFWMLRTGEKLADGAEAKRKLKSERDAKDAAKVGDDLGDAANERMRGRW